MARERTDWARTGSSTGASQESRECMGVHRGVWMVQDTKADRDLDFVTRA